MNIQDKERQPMFQIEHSHPLEYKDSLILLKTMQKNKKLYDAGLPLEDGLKTETFEADFDKAVFSFKYNAKKVHYLPDSAVQTF